MAKQSKRPADAPEFGKVYALTGSRSIAAGDTWQGSQVFCGGVRDGRSGRIVTHAKMAAETFGCTPDHCGLNASLIAAAPELRNALHDVLPIIERLSANGVSAETWAVLESARAALAKADGR